jgi:rhodanese-related sulfurtransferase
MAKVTRVSPAEAHRLMTEEGHLYLDVRSEPEFAGGHPVGALNVPLLHPGKARMEPNAEFLAVVEAVLPKDAKIVVGCRTGHRSLDAAARMMAAGYTAVVEQRAGVDGARDPFGQLVEAGWVEAGLPMEVVTAGGSYAELRSRAGR